MRDRGNVRRLVSRLQAVLLLFGLLAFSLQPSALAQTPFAAQYSPSDFTLYAPASQPITITPLWVYTIFGSNLVTGAARSFSTGTSITTNGQTVTGTPGTLIVSNMIPGGYEVQIYDLRRPNPVSVFTNNFTNGMPASFINAKDYIAVPTNSIIFANLGNVFLQRAGDNGGNLTNLNGANIVGPAANDIAKTNGTGTNTAFYGGTNTVQMQFGSNIYAGPSLDFSGFSSGNYLGLITASGNPGDATFGNFSFNTAHGGFPPSPARNETGVASGGTVAIIMGQAGGGAPAHLQIGQTGFKNYVFVKPITNPFAAGQISPSGASCVQSLIDSNNVFFGFMPGVISLVTNNSSELTWTYSFIEDEGGNDAWDPFALSYGGHFLFGTNKANGAYFHRASFSGGMAGATSTLLTVNTNEIETSGNVTALSTGDTWSIPKVIEGPLKELQILFNNVIQIGVNGSDVETVFYDGASVIMLEGWDGNTASYGTEIRKYGLSVGTNGPAQLAALDVWGGIFTSNQIILPTNYVAASFNPIVGCVTLAPSNGAIWAITQKSTNRIVPGPSGN